MAARSRIGTTNGGWLTIRACPSTTSPSLASACRLSRERAFCRFFSRDLPGLLGGLRLLLPVLALPGLLASATVPRIAAMRSLLVHPGVPDVHRPHPGELSHRLAVGGDRGGRRVERVRRGEAVVARGDREARGHPFHVVLERPGKRLVEVVQVEQEAPFGRAEDAEVRQVRVAAQLDGETRGRGVLQVRGHDLRRAPVEGERRDHHPAVAHRHEVGLAGLCSARRAARPDPHGPRQGATPRGSTAAYASGPPCPRPVVLRCPDAQSRSWPWLACCRARPGTTSPCRG